MKAEAESNGETITTTQKGKKRVEIYCKDYNNLFSIFFAVVTKTVSTTKVAATVKPVSPFAKFRQLDKQSSTTSSPTPR